MSSAACQESSPDCRRSSRRSERSDWVKLWGEGCKVFLVFTGGYRVLSETPMREFCIACKKYVFCGGTGLSTDCVRHQGGEYGSPDESDALA